MGNGFDAGRHLENLTGGVEDTGAPPLREPDSWWWQGPLLGVGGARYQFKAETPEAACLFKDLGAGFPRVEVGADNTRNATIFGLAEHPDGSGRWVMHRNKGRPIVDSDPGVHLDTVIAHMNRSLLDSSTDRVHLHAGAVVEPSTGMAALLLGPSGSGKSVLTTALSLSGFKYLSDEAPGLDPDTGELHPYPKPITLKASAARFFPTRGLLGGKLIADRTRWARYIGVSELGGVAAPARVGLIVALQTSPERGTRIDLLHPAQALSIMAANNFDLERQGIVGFKSLADLAARRPAVQLWVDDLDEAVDLLRSRFMAPAAPGVTLTMLISPDGERGTGLAVVPGVVGAQLGDKAVLWNRSSSDLVTVEGQLELLWRLLDGTRDIGQIIEELARSVGESPAYLNAIRPFLYTLLEIGLLVTT